MNLIKLENKLKSAMHSLFVHVHWVGFPNLEIEQDGAVCLLPLSVIAFINPPKLPSFIEEKEIGYPGGWFHSQFNSTRGFLLKSKRLSAAFIDLSLVPCGVFKPGLKSSQSSLHINVADLCKTEKNKQNEKIL